MRRKISYSCIYTPAQPSKARVMQPRVSEYVMNISPDFGTRQNPTRREGLNLAAGTQKICHFITLSLQKMYPHVGIGRPFQVNLIILFSLEFENIRVELSRATTQPLKAAAARQSLGISFSLQKRKKKSQEAGRVCLCCHVESFILH